MLVSQARDILQEARDYYASGFDHLVRGRKARRANQHEKAKKEFRLGYAQLRVAYNYLHRVIESAQLVIPEEDDQLIDELMKGNTQDIKKAFQILGKYARRAVQDLAWLSKRSRKATRRHKDLQCY